MSTALPDADFVAFQTAVAGQYSLERELGRGGMGIVYLAREVRLDRSVAIKVLPPTLAGRGDVRDRFLREARMAAQLSHPHIVPIFHVDEAGRYVFFVMAYIEGETLGARLRSRGPMPPHAAARVLREVAWALAYAHLRGIVHSDVKPDNILLERGSGRALVMDFGIARLSQESARDARGEVMGSAHFVSPEQVAGSALDGRSDLYSLGVVGYYALTGRLPFEAADARSLVVMHLNQPAPPVAAWAPTVPRKLAQAVDRCLAKRPEQRFATGEALAEAIDISADQPKEIPAPLRVWLAKTERISLVTALGSIWATGATIGLMVSRASLSPYPVLVIAGLIAAGRLWQTRRALKAGYEIEDLRVALRQHVIQRREDLAFELGSAGPLDRILGGTALGFGGLAVVMALVRRAVPLIFAGTGSVAASFFTGAAVISGSFWFLRWLRRYMRQHYGKLRLKFWESNMGADFAKVAGYFLGERATPEHVVRQSTELALGRATDNLFKALPRTIRVQLGNLPATVKRLENEAQQMRQAVASLDKGLAALGDDDPGRRAASPGELTEATAARPRDVARAAHLERQRTRLATDLRARRERASSRLGLAVSALESIRLDLLRLTLGSAAGDQASVTASLTAAIESARVISEEVDLASQAEREVEEVLRSGRVAPL
jgi:predicted Ser/Thr protein kinase